MDQPLKTEDWHIFAAAASTEMDPTKLTRLIAQLCDSLDERDKSRKGQQAGFAA